MRRKTPAPTVTVYGCSASISLRSQIPLGYRVDTYQVTADEAYTLTKAPYVVVNVTEVGAWPGVAIRKLFETGWSVHAVGLIEDEACEVAERALERLRRDIAAGPIEKGTHSQHAARNPLEDPMERELRAYREQVLRELERR